METISIIAKSFVFHQWDSVLSSLKGVSRTEAEWQCPGFEKDIDLMPNFPSNGTILWYVNHISFYKSKYIATLRNIDMNSEENYKPIHDIKKAITSLKKLSTEFCEILNSIDESTLNTKIKHGNVTLIDFISSSIRHDVWHAGQIALLRRLYKHYHQ